MGGFHIFRKLGGVTMARHRGVWIVERKNENCSVRCVKSVESARPIAQ